MNRPFLLGSNLVTCDTDLCDYETFMRTIAGNIGNSYISYALIRECCGAYRNVPQIKSLYAYDFARTEEDVDKVNSECSHLFLILQDQIRLQESYGYQLPYSNIIRFLRKVKRPIVVAGLGANSLTGYDSHFARKLSPDLVRFLRELSGLVHSIGIRGEFTHEVLETLGVKNATVIGCPSYYELGPERTIEKRREWGEGFRLGVSTWVSLGAASSAELFLQDRTELEDKLIRALMFAQPVSLDRDLFDKVMQGKVHVFSSIRKWQERLSKLDMFAGVRVHGAICALNSGIPAVVMNPDSRAREMCEFLNIPYMPDMLRSNDIAEICARADYGKMNREYASKYQGFKAFMQANGVEIVDSRDGQDEDLQPSVPLVSSTVELLRGRTRAEGGRCVSYRLGKWLTKRGELLMGRSADEERRTC